MGVTFHVVDPDTGQEILLHAYRQRGRMVLRRLPAHLALAGATPRRLEQMAEFAKAAWSAYGQRGLVEGLPPAAAAVRAQTTGLMAQKQGREGIDRVSRQTYLRSLVRPDLLTRLEELVELPSKIEIQGTLRGRPARAVREQLTEDPDRQDPR